MKKKKQKKGKLKNRNPIAKSLPNFKAKVVPNKIKYDRKKIDDGE